MQLDPDSTDLTAHRTWLTVLTAREPHHAQP